MMYDTIKLYVEICLLRKGPQDAPYSIWLFRLTIIAYSVINLLLQNLGMDWKSSVLQLVVEVVLITVFVAGMLFVSGKIMRFYQTMTALFGIDAIISFCAIPVLIAMKTGQWPGVTYPLVFAMMIWHWVIIGHIFRHALSSSFSFGLGLAFLLVFGSINVMAMLF